MPLVRARPRPLQEQFDDVRVSIKGCTVKGIAQVYGSSRVQQQTDDAEVAVEARFAQR